MKHNSSRKLKTEIAGGPGCLTWMLGLDAGLAVLVTLIYFLLNTLW